MADTADNNSARHEIAVNSTDEVMVLLSPPKKKYTRILPTNKSEGEVEPHLKDSAKAKGNGDCEMTAAPKSAEVPKRKRGRPKGVINTKLALRKEIKKLGQGYEKIFELLEEMQGTLEFKKELVGYAIQEMKSFKSRELIKHLEQTLKKINKHLEKDK